jgi:hypothetical protein
MIATLTLLLRGTRLRTELIWINWSLGMESGTVLAAPLVCSLRRVVRTAGDTRRYRGRHRPRLRLAVGLVVFGGVPLEPAAIRSGSPASWCCWPGVPPGRRASLGLWS